MDSITEKRRSSIMEELRRNEVVKVSELSNCFGVSEVSIRRDIRYLEQLGALRRVHGGAISVANRPVAGPTMVGTDFRIEQKQRIGRAAAALVAPGDRLIFDSGTTTLQTAAHLSNELLTAGNLTVITASLPIVRQLGAHKGLHLIVLGGIYVPDYELMVGPHTIETLKSLHADKMFLGTDGLTFSQGITTAILGEGSTPAPVNDKLLELETDSSARAQRRRFMGPRGFGDWLFNGDLGVAWPDAEAGGALRVFTRGSDGALRRFAPARLPAHETAFAATVHKSQGSEADRVVLILPHEPSAVMTRELIYTGITRARSRVEVWGTRDAFEAAVARRLIRSSGLRDALWSATA